MKNKLLKGGHLSEKKCREILQLFSEDLTATQIADISGVSRVTVNNYFKLLRTIIASYCEAHYSNNQLHHLLSETLADSEKADGTDACFGLSLHDNKVHSKWLRSVCSNKVKQSLNADQELSSGLSDFHAISDCSDWEIFWLKPKNAITHHSKSDISGFWLYTKTRLQKFRGLNKNTLYLHIKECEFRFNGRNEDLYNNLQQVIDWKYQRKHMPSIKTSLTYSSVLQ